MKRKALITGITGQDGSYLAELLLSKDYEVHGLVRRASLQNTGRIEHLMQRLTLHEGDLGDSGSVRRVLAAIEPDEVYNLAAQSHVPISLAEPEYTAEVDALGVLRLLEGLRTLGMSQCRFYQASSSELFGEAAEIPQRESTPFRPGNPYAIAKQFAFWTVREYRNTYGMFACNGILYNHESERRGESFVTRKITRAAGRIACGLQDVLELGNLSSLRDWGYAPDYVECMYRMLRYERPEDFVIATGVQHSVREFVTLAFAHNGITLRWQGEGADEIGVDTATGKTLVRVNPKWYRPADVDTLLGDPAKAKRLLAWEPQRTSFEQLVARMAEHDHRLARREKENAFT